jgi:hypothetical protein
MTMRLPNTRYSARSYSSAFGSVGTGSHEGSQDVVRVAVEILACTVVAQGGARVGMPGGDLDGTQSTSASSIVVTNVSAAYAGECRRCVPGGLREMPETPGGCVPVHPPAMGVEQDRPCGPASDGAGATTRADTDRAMP